MYIISAGMDAQMNKILSATFLNICLKGWITFEVENKKVIVTLKESGKEDLTKDEKRLYQYMKEVARQRDVFSMKDFEKYSEKNVTEFQRLIKSIKEKAKETNVKLENYDLEKKKTGTNYAVKMVLYFLVMACFFSIGIFYAIVSPNLWSIIPFITVILSIYTAVLTSILSGRFNGFTQRSIDEREKWSGLKKFMQDFSMLDKREVPELILWEKYLVYATAFGVAEKVIKQLKVRFPELQDETYMRNNFTYMYIACNHTTNFNFINSINSSIGSSMNYSSGSGSGGGFSGGGGGRSEAAGGMRRPLKVLRIINKKKEDARLKKFCIFFY